MDNASGAGKKTIQPHDVLVALRDTEFDFMIPRIEAELKSTFDQLPFFVFDFSCLLTFHSSFPSSLAMSFQEEKSESAKAVGKCT